MEHGKLLHRLKGRFVQPEYGDVFGHGFWADVIRKHKIQSKAHPDGGCDWSCSCGENGHSADQRDHWMDVGIRALNRRGGSMQLPPDLELLRRKGIFAALDREIRRRKQVVL